MKRTLTLLVLAAVGCGGDDGGVLDNVEALVILQRTPRLGGIGDVFQYTSYEPGGKLLKLSPPTADGTVTELCCSQFGAEFAQIDIQGYDIAFDAGSIVFSGKLTSGERYGLFLLTLDDQHNAAGPPAQLATDMARDYVYPIFAPSDRIVFVTNAVVEAGAPQHLDEYERGTTTQLGSIGADGSGEVLGPRNLSHRVAPSMLLDGHVLFTQWDHLGEVNSGHLMMTNPDFTNLREVFGKEGTGITNSYLKAVEIPRDSDSEAPRLVTVATDRDRTLQSGKLIQVTLGRMEDGAIRVSESRSSFMDLTPLVPPDNEPSYDGVGRYYDAYPLADKEGHFGDRPAYLVSWADGPVEEEQLEAAGDFADFGIYLYNSERGRREPIYNDAETWEIFARPLQPRPAPLDIAPSGTNTFSDSSLLIGSLNVYDSSTNAGDLPAGSVVGVRIIEGFSGEEGIPSSEFGLTEHEGAAIIGSAPVYSDGSWAALVPANTPLHLQPYDRFGMALVNEPVWISGRPGESRMCGGCHEDRAKTVVVGPGVSQALSNPVSLDRPRSQRISINYTSIDGIVGVPWDTAVQAVFDNNCVSCHNGVPGPANPSYRITDPVTMTSQDIVFDLRGGAATYGLGDAIMSGYSQSHLSLLGPMMMDLEEAGLIVEGEIPIYVMPGSARTSELLRKLNPPQLFPFDANVRAFEGVTPHLVQLGLNDLSAEEYYILIVMADNGGQFYSRENATGY